MGGGEAASNRSPLGRILRNEQFLTVWLVPFFVFVATLLLWTYGFMNNYYLCGAWTVLGLVASGIMILNSGAGPCYAPVGVACLPALVIGSVLGLFLYDTYAIFPNFYAHTRKYTNVVPSEPSAAVADAGKIVFTSESFLDTAHAVSFVGETGIEYCVAPVNDNNNLTRIEFWAAGLDCCGPQGEFACDAAADGGAHSGIVVFDNNGYFQEARHDYYDRARMKAESTFNLQSVERPLFVRWVREANLDMLSTHYRNMAVAMWFGLGWAYLVLSAVFAYNTYPARKEYN